MSSENKKDGEGQPVMMSIGVILLAVLMVLVLIGAIVFVVSWAWHQGIAP